METQDWLYIQPLHSSRLTVPLYQLEKKDFAPDPRSSPIHRWGGGAYSMDEDLIYVSLHILADSVTCVVEGYPRVE